MSLVHSNLRVDIAGGTLDLWPLFNFVGGAKTINAALSLKATCEFNLLASSSIDISIANLNYQKTFSNIQDFFASNDSEIQILKPVLKNYKFPSGFKIKTESQSPVGGGLGGSSTLLISIIKAIDLDLKITRSESQIVDFACNLESEILGTPAGTQDYFQAVQAGLSVIHFSAAQRQRDFFKSPWLENTKSQFKLIYSGHPHHSGLNNWQIFQKCVQGDKATLNTLHALKDLSEQVFVELQTAKAPNMSQLLHQELELRRQLATGFVNEPLEKIILFLQDIGVLNFKICGAGGGGCLWALVPDVLHKDLLRVKSLHSEIQIIDCELVL